VGIKGKVLYKSKVSPEIGRKKKRPEGEELLFSGYKEVVLEELKK